MAETTHYKFPLYDPLDAPDLTQTGREAQAIEAIDTALYEESEAREAADTELSKQIAREASERKEADEAEATAREAADTALEGKVADEAEAREAADTALGERIDAEADTRATEYEALKGKIELEAQTRETADASLEGKVSAETTAREAADTALGERIDAETQAREAAGGETESKLAELEGKVSAEAEARQEQDAVLGTEITGLNNSVNGIIGLNYGADNDPLVKVDEGAYSSPALEKIAKQFEESGGDGFYIITLSESGTYTLTQADVDALTSKPALVVFIRTLRGVVGQGSFPMFLARTTFTGLTYKQPIERVTTDKTGGTISYDYWSVSVGSRTVGTKVESELKSETFTLPPATTTSLGGVKVGSGLSVDDAGLLSAAASGVQVAVAENVNMDSAVSIDKIEGKIIGVAMYRAILTATNRESSLYNSTAYTSANDSSEEVITLTIYSLYPESSVQIGGSVNVTIDRSGSTTEVKINTATGTIFRALPGTIYTATTATIPTLYIFYLPA